MFMSRKKIILYFIVIGITMVSLNIQFKNLMTEDEINKYKNTIKVSEYYPFREEDKQRQYAQPKEDEKDQIEDQKNTDIKDQIEDKKEEPKSLSKEEENKEIDLGDIVDKKSVQDPYQFIIPYEDKEYPIKDKNEQKVLSYSHLKEITKEVGLKDKFVLLHLIKNIDDTSMKYIKGMIKDGLTSSEIRRIEDILQRTLNSEEFKKAQGILDKYIPRE